MGNQLNPVCVFKDITQARELLKQWQNILSLSNWTIKVKMVEPHEFILNDVDGECEYEVIQKCAVIRILKPQYYGDRILKYCAERILVHELLHCKLSLLKTEDDGFNTLMHQIHEDIAKALICAKYGITSEWFSNISYDDDED